MLFVALNHSGYLRLRSLDNGHCKIEITWSKKIALVIYRLCIIRDWLDPTAYSRKIRRQPQAFVTKKWFRLRSIFNMKLFIERSYKKEPKEKF
jgi:hypothetical protein